MTVRSSFVSVTKSWPPALVLAIQAAASCLVSFLLAHLSVLVGKLTPTELAYIWVPLTGLYFTGVKEAEKKWPSWTWLLYLLPTKLPQMDDCHHHFDENVERLLEALVDILSSPIEVVVTSNGNPMHLTLNPQPPKENP